MSSQKYSLVDRLTRHVANGNTACAAFYRHFHVDPSPILSDPAAPNLTATLRPNGSIRQFPNDLIQRREYLPFLPEVYELSCRNNSLLRTLHTVIKDANAALIHDLDWGTEPTMKWNNLPNAVCRLFTDFSAESALLLAGLRECR